MSQQGKVAFLIIIEIEEYARYLGMNPAEDQDLMWIPEQGVFSFLMIVESTFA